MSEKKEQTIARTASLTVVAMLAFAANSLLCRLALAQDLIDAATFTSVRIIAGAVTLGLIVLVRKETHEHLAINWRTVAVLFIYMIFFSFAYLSLSAGTGALLLFGSVQLTMFVVALREGEQFPLLAWGGFALAFLGLIFLVLPGVSAPNPLGAILMTVAGIAWGFYSLLGRNVADPLVATAKNFMYSVPLVLIVSLFFLPEFSSSSGGLALAIASGAITSGCGYVVWYAALPGLTATRAATVQLSVPVIAAFGGILVLSELITLRLLVASAATLGGIAIVLAQRVEK
ncbi:MAG: DMT family transporter [Deltaproteobacteria bacterium]|nr:DMT family transporter [Deltaproteobacteria bacterium]